MLDTYSFRELTFFADKSQFTMISVTKQNLVINLEWQEAEPSDRYKSCPSSKLHLHSSLFFFSFILRSFFFLYETSTLFFHESTHQLVPLLISQSIYDLEKKNSMPIGNRATSCYFIFRIICLFMETLKLK